MIQCARSFAAGFLALALASAAAAAPNLYTHDEVGRLAIVDVGTGNVTLIGTMGAVMTDIAFAPDGRLFGITFTALYQIDPATAATTFIGSHGVPGGNALVFGGDDVLYAAGGTSTNLYQIDPANGSTASLGSIGALSAGDLAFHGPDFFLSSQTGELVRIDLGPPVSASVVGATGFFDVFGLATADDGVLYGVSGTQVFAIDTATGAGTLVTDYGGQGVTATYGSSFLGEALPTCPAVPLSDCLVADKAKLKVVEKKRGSEKWKLAMKGFSGPTAQVDFGDPVTGATVYDVCLFRDDGSPVVRLTVDRAGAVCAKGKPCWKAKGDKGYAYKDAETSASGVKKIATAAGPVGKGKLAVQAGNKAKKGQDALPHGIAARMTGTTSALVQVSADDALCYEAELTSIQKADGGQFSGKKP